MNSKCKNRYATNEPSAVKAPHKSKQPSAKVIRGEDLRNVKDVKKVSK